MSFGSNWGRSQQSRADLRRSHQHELVHAAGCTEPDCAARVVYLDPWTPLNEFDDPPAPGVGHEVLALGVRIPRSLRGLCQKP
jgi:hypothetical protein